MFYAFWRWWKRWVNPRRSCKNSWLPKRPWAQLQETLHVISSSSGKILQLYHNLITHQEAKYTDCIAQLVRTWTYIVCTATYSECSSLFSSVFFSTVQWFPTATRSNRTLTPAVNSSSFSIAWPRPSNAWWAKSNGGRSRKRGRRRG